jgi:hypothetical protein
MMLDGKRCPRFIWRTTEDNDQAAGPGCEAFGWDEGEGDRSRDWWLVARRRDFALYWAWADHNCKVCSQTFEPTIARFLIYLEQLSRNY